MKLEIEYSEVNGSEKRFLQALEAAERGVRNLEFPESFFEHCLSNKFEYLFCVFACLFPFYLFTTVIDRYMLLSASVGFIADSFQSSFSFVIVLL